VILERAAEIVLSYDTGVTLRQLHYRLTSELLIPNSDSAYKTLSARTAEARRAGSFPALLDRVRTIHRYQTFAGSEDARQWLVEIYRRDRTELQAWNIYLGVEKAGIVEQLRAWFGDLGVSILALVGYASQTYVDEVVEEIERDDRPSVLLYAGDFDPSGEDIDRDFEARTACFDKIVRVALTPQQVEDYDLPPQMGKATDSRARSFIARHGQLVQVELDALPPDVLRSLYRDALMEFWDESAYLSVLELEASEREELQRGNANGS